MRGEEEIKGKKSRSIFCNCLLHNLLESLVSKNHAKVLINAPSTVIRSESPSGLLDIARGGVSICFPSGHLLKQDFRLALPGIGARKRTDVVSLNRAIYV